LNQNWSVKAEYLYAQFQHSATVGNIVTTGGAFEQTTVSAGLSLQIARVGLNYQFH
jgi:opacity protein-like surface antigen